MRDQTIKPKHEGTYFNFNTSEKLLHGIGRKHIYARVPKIYVFPLLCNTSHEFCCTLLTVTLILNSCDSVSLCLLKCTIRRKMSDTCATLWPEKPVQLYAEPWSFGLVTPLFSQSLPDC